MKRKFADKREIPNILTATYKKIAITDDPVIVAASLVDVYEVTDKLKIGRKDGREDTIIDTAYKWITLFLKDEKYVIESAINAKSEIVQFNFDVCKSCNYKSYIPVRKDLYVDVNLSSRREIEFFGEDELENAYNMGDISRKNYEIAKKTADRIVNKYGREEELRKLVLDTQKYLARLMAAQESKEIDRRKGGGFEIEGMKELFGKGEYAEMPETVEKPKEKKPLFSFLKKKPISEEEESNKPPAPGTVTIFDEPDEKNDEPKDNKVE